LACGDATASQPRAVADLIEHAAREALVESAQAVG
jgi:hypothetical protein